MQNSTKVIVIGDLVRQDLFLKEKDAVGNYINLSGISYKVVGVFKDDGGDDEEFLKTFCSFRSLESFVRNNSSPPQRIAG